MAHFSPALLLLICIFLLAEWNYWGSTSPSMSLNNATEVQVCKYLSLQNPENTWENLKATEKSWGIMTKLQVSNFCIIFSYSWWSPIPNTKSKYATEVQVCTLPTFPSSAYIPLCWVGLLGEVHCVSAGGDAAISIVNVLKTIEFKLNSESWRIDCKTNLWYVIVNDSCHYIEHAVILNWGAKLWWLILEI